MAAISPWAALVRDNLNHEDEGQVVDAMQESEQFDEPITVGDIHQMTECFHANGAPVDDLNPVVLFDELAERHDL
jgi:hypothetical protein